MRLRPCRDRGIAAVVLVVLCLAISGCGRDLSPQPVASGLDPLQPSMPAGSSSATPGTELSDPKALISMPWRLAAISEDRRAITVWYVGGDGYCVKHEGYHLAHEGSELRLGESTAAQTATRPARPACRWAWRPSSCRWPSTERPS